MVIGPVATGSDFPKPKYSLFDAATHRFLAVATDAEVARSAPDAEPFLLILGGRSRLVYLMCGVPR